MLMKKPLVSLVAGLMLLIIIIETSMIASIYFKNSNTTNSTHPVQGTNASSVQNSGGSGGQNPFSPFIAPFINQATPVESSPTLVVNSGSPYYGEETGIPTENFTV